MKVIATFLTMLTVSVAQAHAAPISLILQLKQNEPIEDLAKSVTDPSSPRFQKPYSVAEIRQTLAMSDDAFQDLSADFQKQGIQVVHVDAIRQYLTLSAEQTQLESAFGLTFNFSARGQHFTQPSGAPATLSQASLAEIEAIVNSDDRVTVSPQLKVLPTHTDDTTDDSAPLGGFSPTQVNQYYGFDQLPKGMDGSGEKIAAIAFGSVSPSYVAHFLARFDLSSKPDITVELAGRTQPDVVPCPDSYTCTQEQESDVDLEMALRAAPGASLISYLGGTDDFLESWVAMLTSILDRGDIFIITNSNDADPNPDGSITDDCESQMIPSDFLKSVDPLFARAVAQGVTIFSSSGDEGSDQCQDKSQQLLWPSTPYVVSVGGTTLKLGRGDKDGQIEAEEGWNGSGGGFSHLYDRPSWQTDPAPQFTTRGEPDVAFVSGTNKGQSVYSVLRWDKKTNKPVIGWGSWGGTSLASPSWAGFLARVNQARVQAKKPRLPFLAPILYAMSSEDRTKGFNDIVSGSNGFYGATKGWDAVTGLGSPKVPGLYDYLVNY